MIYKLLSFLKLLASIVYPREYSPMIFLIYLSFKVWPYKLKLHFLRKVFFSTSFRCLDTTAKCQSSFSLKNISSFMQTKKLSETFLFEFETTLNIILLIVNNVQQYLLPFLSVVLLLKRIFF